MITPVVLVLYVSTMMVGSCWGTDWITAKDNPDVRYWLNYKEDKTPEIKDNFTIEIKAEYKYESISKLSILEPSAFKIMESKNEPDNILGVTIGGWKHTFSLQAPTKPGTYICSFEGVAADFSQIYFAAPISVSKKAKDLRLYILGGGIICGIASGMATYNSGASSRSDIVSPILASLLGFAVGALVGGIIGDALTPEPEENLVP